MSNTVNKTAGRQWKLKPYIYFYVSSLPGADGGKDWGYDTDAKKAIPLTPYWQRRFRNMCIRVGATANFYEITEGTEAVARD